MKPIREWPVLFQMLFVIAASPVAIVSNGVHTAFRWFDLPHVSGADCDSKCRPLEDGHGEG